MADFKYEKPFASLLGSREASMVDLRGYCSDSLEVLEGLLSQCEALGG